MKKILVGMIWLTLISILISTIPAQAHPGFTPEMVRANNYESGDVVTFRDPNLEALIREIIDKPAGDIYESDLLAITSLTGSFKISLFYQD